MVPFPKGQRERNINTRTVVAIDASDVAQLCIKNILPASILPFLLSYHFLADVLKHLY